MNSLSNSDPKENICIYTYNQTGGRGQIGRFWYSGTDKNLTTSFRIPLDDFAVKDQFLINIAFALAIKSLLSEYIKEKLTIKWPNDIYVGDNKIAGILIQNNLRADKINSTILGVGININEDDFPSDLPNPISLYQLLRKEHDLTSLQHKLSDQVIQLLSLLEENRKVFFEKYLSSLYLLNKDAIFIIDDKKVSGIIRGVTDQGKLELEVQGQRRLFNFRELGYHLSGS